MKAKGIDFSVRCWSKIRLIISPLIIIIILILLPIKAECLESGLDAVIANISTWWDGVFKPRQTFPSNLKPQEKKYWEFRNNKVQEMINLTSFSSINIGDNGRQNISEVRREVRRILNVQESNLNALKNYSPPSIFKAYHEYTIMFAKSILIFTRESGNLFLEAADYIEYKLNQGQSFDDESRAKLPIWESRFNVIMNDYFGMLDTYDNKLKSQLNIINAQLIRRNTSGTSSNLINYANSSSVAVSFKPHIIPVKVKLNSRGDISFEGEYSIPTPIGTFALSGATIISQKKTLTIFTKNKKSVYDLGDRSYSFDLNSISAKPKFVYDGKGNIKIFLN